MSENTCEWCSGTGQISFFKGVSRFLISTEECPECSGLGFITEKKNSPKIKKKSSAKKKKKAKS